MRVIAGDLRGRRLLAPRGWRVRPTSDRVREAIFSALGDIAGLAVLDLYCGTGALAIEALSRGAAHATLVDRDTRAAIGNVEHLGLRDRATLVRADAAQWAAEPGTEDGAPATFDLVFLDPPYRLAAAVAAELEHTLPRRLSAGGRLVVECSARRPLQLSLPVLRERRYGGTLVTFYGEAGR